MERTLTALRKKLKGDIYVWLRNEEVSKRFLQNAEDEGFTIDSDRPTAKPAEQIMALHDGKISYVGANGRIRFGCGDTKVFHRVDYEKYLTAHRIQGAFYKNKR